jgi:hypothetical protein
LIHLHQGIVQGRWLRPSIGVPGVGRDAELAVLTPHDQYIAVTHQTPEFAYRAGRDPDLGQVTHPCQVCQQFAVGPVTFVGGPLHGGDVRGMRHVDRPADVRQLLGQIGHARGRLNGRTLDLAVSTRPLASVKLPLSRH